MSQLTCRRLHSMIDRHGQRLWIFFVAWVLASVTSAVGQDNGVGSLWVDNVRGADNNPGSGGKPFLSIAKGLEQLKPDMTLHVLPTAKPYKNRKEQKTDPLHNTLYIRLPEGKTLDEISVESIAGGGGRGNRAF